MGPRTTELVQLLEQAATLLRAAGELHWVQWLEGDARELRGGDFHGIEHFLNAFGGAGGINDGMGNELLRDVLSRAYALATELRREHLRMEDS